MFVPGDKTTINGLNGGDIYYYYYYYYFSFRTRSLCMPLDQGAQFRIHWEVGPLLW